MARKKVILQYIKGRATRRATFRKRRAGLLKKMEEITILCGISGFVIIYDPEERDPVVWPSLELAHEMLHRYWHMPELDRCRKMMDHQTFLHERIKKIEEQLLKQQKINSEMEISLLMHQIYNEGKPLSNFSYEELMNLLRYADKNWKEVSKKVAQNYQPIDTSSPDSGMLDEISNWLQMLDERMVAPEQTLEEQWFMEPPRNDDQKSGIIVNYGNSNIGQQAVHPILGNFGVRGGVNDMVIPQRLFESSNSIGGNMRFLYGSSSGGNRQAENGLFWGNFGRNGLSEGNFGRIGSNDHIVFPYDNNFGGNANGPNLGTGLPYRNFGGSIIADNNIGLGTHQGTFGRSNNGINMGTFGSNHEHH